VIGRLRGMLVAKGPAGVVIDVGGVGYEVAVTARALVELPSVGEEAVLHTHLYVREDVMALYGFATAGDRDVFRILLGVSGVGPRVALAMLGALTVDDLRTAVLAEDVGTLSTVPGIGKRSAQKLILELRPKFDLPDAELPGGGGSVLAEVREALEGLGYQAAEIRAATAGLPGDGSLEDLLRTALRELGKAGRE
jgi:holliday junction DNA helicase RuvA